MENKLEQLLNSLIKRGRVPFGDEKIHSFEIIYVTGKIRNIVAKRGRGQVNMHYSIRDIMSKSSGLWQFVCENEMVEKGGLFWELGYSSGEIDLESRRRRQDYEYRLIRSALKDESELEDFLLKSIKLD